MKNVLYLSCHAILEYDECKLLSEAGYNVRAIGSYTNPHSPGDPKRPAIQNMEVNHQHIDLANRFHQDNIHQETLDWADIIVFMHMPQWIQDQLDKLKGWNKPVIFRSIGQSSDFVELQLNNFRSVLGDKFKIIKYSDRELLWRNNAGADAIIPFYKDIPYMWNAWNNPDTQDIAFCVQAATQRGDHCHFDDLELMTKEFSSRTLFGPSNENWANKLKVVCPNYEELLQQLAKHKVLVYSGTCPASYTLSPIEAAFVGIPIVTINKAWYRKGHEGWIPSEMFEVPDWFPDETIATFNEGVSLIRKLTGSKEYAKEISEKQTNFVRNKFSALKIQKMWKELLNA